MGKFFLNLLHMVEDGQNYEIAELRVKILKFVGKKVKGFPIITTTSCRVRHIMPLSVLICLAFQGWGIFKASDVIYF